MFRLGLLIAWRTKFWLVAIWLLLVLLIVSLSSSQFSGRQPSTVALDMGLSFLRLGLPAFIALLLQELVSKEFERRYFLYSLTYPYSRIGFLFARFGVTIAITLGVLLIGAFFLEVIVFSVESSYEQSRPVSLGAAYWLTIFFVFVDLLAVASVALLLSVVAKTPGFVLLGTLGFTIVARSYSAIIALLSGDVIVIDSQDQYRSSLGFLEYILPDLGGMDIRYIALYNDLSQLSPNILWQLGSVLAFSCAVVLLAFWLFKNRGLA